MNLQVTFDFTVEDWNQFQLHYISTSSLARRRRLVLSIGIVAFFLALVFLKGPRPSSSPEWVIMLLIMAAVVYIVTRFHIADRFSVQICRRRLFSSGLASKMFGSYKVSLTDEYYSTEHREGEVKYRWQTFEKRMENESYLFLYNSPASAICIPKLRIEPESARDEFLSYIRSRVPLLES